MHGVVNTELRRCTHSSDVSVNMRDELLPRGVEVNGTEIVWRRQVDGAVINRCRQLRRR